MPKTVLSAFPYVKKYAFFCVASNQPMQLDPEKRTALRDRFSPTARAFFTRVDPRWYTGGEDYIRNTTAGYPVNEDLKPVCEYFLGLRFNEAFVY